MAGDDVTIVVRADSGQAVRAFRDVNGQLRDMRGRFVSEGAVMTRSMNSVAASIGGLRGLLIPLATAAVPLGAALAPVAVKAAAAGAAVAAFGAAVAGQVSGMSEAADAQDKYTDAVAKYGRNSQQAAAAGAAVSASLAVLPKATQRAAIGLQDMKSNFQSWSDEMASFTMAPVEKSFTLLSGLFPKLTPMVRGASEQFDRLLNVAGGAMATPGFDALSQKVSAFANEALRDAVTGVIRFSRALSEGRAGGPVKAFMEYATENGPALRETLANVGEAVATLVEAAADAGPGMLTLVNAAAGLVAALPPGLVTVLLQTAFALKAVSLAGAAVAGIAGGLAAARTQILALGAASTAAGGGVAGLRAAFASLSTAAKASVVVAGLALIALGVKKLADSAREAPPNVDRLTTSLKGLAATGKFTGELKKAFGDINGLVEDIGKIGQAAKDQEEYVKSFGTSGIKPLDDLRRGFHNLLDDFRDGEDSFKALEGRFQALDESMAAMVSSGHAGEAAEGFELVKRAALAQGKSLDEVRAQFPGYLSAVEDLKFEQQLAAEGMGIFGKAAQDTQAKLDAQKQSAEGLRASILALNDANRSAYDSQIQFEESIDNLAASFKEHGSTLDINTEAGQKNGRAMSQAAAAHDEMLSAGLAAGESLGSMTKKSDELRSSMMRLATDAFDGNKKKATEYVNALLGVPGEIETLVKLEREEAIAGLKAVQAEIEETPGAKTVTVETLNAAAIAALEAVGLKTRTLPDGRTEVFTANGKAIGSIGAVRKALDKLNGKTANTYINTYRTTYHKDVRVGGISNPGTGGPGGFPKNAHGGLIRRYADGGGVQGFPAGGPVSGPGTGTSDDILAWLSNGEYVVNARQTQRFLPLLQAINQGRMPAGPAAGARRGGTGALPAGASGGQGGGEPILVQLVLDGNVLAEQLVDPQRRVVARRGGVQATYGRL